MDVSSDSEFFTSVLLVNNLHCPSCVSFVEEVLRPRSDISHLSVSIVNHEIRFQHRQLDTAAIALQELQSNAFDMHYVKIKDAAGRVVTEYAIDGTASQQPIYTWPLFLSKTQRKHIDNCDLCRHKTATRPKRAKIWAAVRRRNKSWDVEKQLEETHRTDGSAPSEDSPKKDSIDGENRGKSEVKYSVSLSIAGMTCVSCQTLITSELEELEFVDRCVINLMTHSGSVVYRGAKENVDQLLETIDNLGYEASVEEIKQSLAPNGSETSLHTYTASLVVEGLRSSSCIEKILDDLQDLPSVGKVDIRLAQSSAEIKFSGKNSINEILTRFGELGYSATLIHLKDEGALGADDGGLTERSVTIAVEGMYCEHCPENILDALQRQYGRSIVIEQRPVMQNPHVTIRYKPNPPVLTVRQLVKTISDVHEAFSAKVWHPATLEERSRAIQRYEQWHIFGRLVFTFLVAIPVLIIGIVYMSLVPSDDPVRIWFEEPVWAGNVSRREWALFIMTTPVMFFGADYFHTRAFKEVRALWRPSSKVPILRRLYRFGSMNMLISAGTGVAYVSSVAILILDAQENPLQAAHGHSSSYFDAVAFLSFFILIGKFLEAYSKTKTGDAVAMLSKLRPEEALLVEAAAKEGKVGGESSANDLLPRVPVDQLELGDKVSVLHGVSPPTDGVIVSAGTFLFDESSLTGESKPIKKSVGDSVFTGSVNISQPVTLYVTGVGGTSMLDKIVDVVREGQTKRAPVERIADTVTGYFVPVITLLAVITFVVWASLGAAGVLPDRYRDNERDSWAFWSLEFAIAVFVVACPCGLGLAAPTALFVGGGLAAKHGILVRGGGEAFQEASKLQKIVFDKTGTLTEGKMTVTGFEMLDSQAEKWSKSLALSLSQIMEQSSTHPLAMAIAAYCNEQMEEEEEGTVKIADSDIVEIPGQGMRGTFTVQLSDGKDVQMQAGLGNQRLMSTLSGSESTITSGDNPYVQQILHNFQSRGQSTAILYLREHSIDSKTPSHNFQPVAVYGISDPVRPSAPAVLSSLRNHHGLQVHMCTGDNGVTALAIASQLDIPPSNVAAGVTPVEKANYVNELRIRSEALDSGSSTSNQRKSNIVAFVGDGTNDTPALSAADVSIALSSGSDVAVSTASFILLNSDLETILQLVRLAKRVFGRVKWNFVWAAMYNVLLIPVAAGVFFRLGDLDGETGTGWRLGPVWASAAMALSSVSVVLSSLALRLPPFSPKALFMGRH